MCKTNEGAQKKVGHPLLLYKKLEIEKELTSFENDVSSFKSSPSWT